MNHKNVPIPARMAHLPRDPRGLPIPSVILIDTEGKANFTVNDERTRQFHIANDLCAISGLPLHRGRWFVGGPLSAFHPGGRYIDTPMHYECLEYALQVCPYLAARSYSKKTPESPAGHITLVDPTMMPDRPEVFVAVMCVGQTQTIDPFGFVKYLAPKRPYRRVEFWRKGAQIGFEEGLEAIFSGRQGDLMRQNGVSPEMARASVQFKGRGR